MLHFVKKMDIIIFLKIYVINTKIKLLTYFLRDILKSWPSIMFQKKSKDSVSFLDGLSKMRLRRQSSKVNRRRQQICGELKITCEESTTYTTCNIFVGLIISFRNLPKISFTDFHVFRHCS